MSDEEDLTGEKLAMQSRCPTCLGEQYVLNVIPFSQGNYGCSVCGAKTKPMTYEQWRAALRKARERDEGPR